MKRSSARWLVIGAFVAIIILVANVLVTYRNTDRLYQSTLVVAHTHDVLSALDNVLSLAKDAETGQRGYIITGEESYLEPYNAAVGAINRQADEIAALTADDPRQQERIPELRSRIAAKLNELDRTIALRKNGGYEAARAVVSSGHGKAEMDGIRSIVGQMTADENDLRNERLASRDQAFRAAISEGLFSGVFAIAAIIAFLLLLRRHLAERERTTFVIAEQSERLRTTLASIGDGVIATDTDGRITMMNAVAESLTGWPFSDAISQPLASVFNIVNETTRNTVENPVTRALEEGAIVGLANHTVLISKDGTERPIDDSAAPIRCAAGEIVGCVLVFKDVSERKRDEQNIVQMAAEADRQRRLYETVLTNTPDFIYVFSLDHRVVYANEALIKMWGRGYEGAIGKTFLEIGYEPWHAEMHDREIDQVAATKQPIRGEVPFTGTGGTRQYDYIFVPIIGADGQVEAVAGTTRDVTERKEAEEIRLELLKELETQNAFFDAVLTQVPAAIVVADAATGQIMMSNEEAHRIVKHEYHVGKRLGDYGNTYIVEAFATDGTQYGPGRWPLDRALAGEIVVGEEIEDVLSDGSHVIVRVNAGPIRVAGKVVAAVVAFHDITARRRAEERQAFLIRLGDSLRPLSDPVEVQAEASRVLGEHLGANRVVYFEIRGDEYIIERDYTSGVSTLVGRYPVAAFGPALLAVLLDGRTVIEADATTQPDRSPAEQAAFAGIHVRGHVDVPLVKDGRFVAGMTVQVSEVRDWTAEEVGLIEETAERTWAAVERTRAEKELIRARDELEVRVAERTTELAEANIELHARAEERHRAQEERLRLLGQVISSQEDERQRIARDMHDDLGQRLTALRLHLEAVGSIVGADPAAVKIAEIKQIARQLDSDVTSIVWKLRPAAIDDRGLIRALDEYVGKWSANFSIPVEFRAGDIDESALSIEFQTCLYRITQEALNNIYKYAEASNVTVLLDHLGQDISLIIEDDGKGFELSQNKDRKSGFGLIGMRERAALLGGTVDIESSPGRGTTIFVRIPVGPSN